MCGLTITIADDRIVGVSGDKDHPLTRGFACSKGLQAVEAHYGKDRLLRPLKRKADGAFEEISSGQALDEIGAKLRVILDRDGPGAIAGYRGTINVYSASAAHMLRDWLGSLGSTAYYTTMTIDQSAKFVTAQRLGVWMAGKQSLTTADVMLYAGNNPLVSLAGPGLMHNPVKTLKAAKARGMKLIVIDPRETETAQFADLHLRPRPGCDAILAAGFLNVTLTNNWHDAQFCGRFVNGLDDLAKAVAGFTPAFVEAHTGIPASQLAAAAHMFAAPIEGRQKRGIANAATGVTMSPHGNLADHLYECLNVICGRFVKAGETIPQSALMQPAYPALPEGIFPPSRDWENGWKSRIGGYGTLFGERMTVELADEILTPGDGQIRALFVAGGNPANAIPDQAKVERAFCNLDLLVTIDPYMTTTAQLSHYILPPSAFFEHADMLADRVYSGGLIGQPLAQYTPPLVPPPAGADVVEDAIVFWELSQRIGIQLMFDGVPLDMGMRPTLDDLHEILLRNGPVDLATLREHSGQILPLDEIQIVSAGAEDAARFAVMPNDVSAELKAVISEADLCCSTTAESPFTHVLISRRIRDASNSMYRQLPSVRKRLPVNPLWLHPDDLAGQGLQEGQSVTIVSKHGRITASVAADVTMKRGVVSMTHGWGGLVADQMNGCAQGVSVTRLVSSTEDLEPINAMPQQSAIPVRLEH
jgi:anaerobic selenocysteine-containing dehydrogenase